MPTMARDSNPASQPNLGPLAIPATKLADVERVVDPRVSLVVWERRRPAVKAETRLWPPTPTRMMRSIHASQADAATIAQEIGIAPRPGLAHDVARPLRRLRDSHWNRNARAASRHYRPRDLPEIPRRSGHAAADDHLSRPGDRYGSRARPCGRRMPTMCCSPRVDPGPTSPAIPASIVRPSRAPAKRACW